MSRFSVALPAARAEAPVDKLARAYESKPLVDVDGAALFAELAAVRLFVKAGWTALWRDGYQGGRWVADGDLSRRPAEPQHGSLGAAVVVSVRAERGGMSGCWDVVAWRDDLIAFVECKRRARDQLQPTQGLWLAAALRAGIPSAAFAVLEWD